MSAADPLTVRRGRGQPITTKTKFGRFLRKHNLKARVVAVEAGIYPRLMTEYIQARRVIREDHLEILCFILDCKPEEIVEPGLTANITDATGRPMGELRGTSVKALDRSYLEPEPEDIGPVTPKPLKDIKIPRLPNAHPGGVAPPRIIR
jgi:DNA-binding Xre family transcriptional regulator